MDDIMQAVDSMWSASEALGVTVRVDTYDHEDESAVNIRLSVKKERYEA